MTDTPPWKPVPCRELAEQMRRLGLPEGRPVMVHASLRALGPVEGGAGGVVEALQRAVGPTGTLMMMIAADGSQPFDRLATPADPENGVLAEVFRTSPGVEVNDHPACRFAALGPSAERLLHPQPIDDYFGPGSPLERLVEARGAVLRLGADVDTVTLTHHAENLASVPEKRRKARSYRLASGGTLVCESIDDSEGIAEWPGGDYFASILVDFVSEGRAVVGPVGRCTAELLDGATFVDFAVEWLERELAGSRGC